MHHDDEVRTKRLNVKVGQSIMTQHPTKAASLTCDICLRSYIKTVLPFKAWQR
jgi:hypothetical protein